MSAESTEKRVRREYLVENDIDDQQQSEEGDYTEEDGTGTGGGHFAVKFDGEEREVGGLVWCRFKS